MSEEKYIGVDFDGTLAFYDEWKGPGILGEPISVMVERVKTWLAHGKRVKIFTARVSSQYADIERQAIQQWCKLHLGQELDVTCTKCYLMEEFWDDSAIQVVKNTGLRADGAIDIPFEPGDIGICMR